MSKVNCFSSVETIFEALTDRIPECLAESKFAIINE